MVTGFLLFALTFVGMEGVAWWTHKYLMHGPLWVLHESHHRPRGSRFERNDLFGVFFSVPSIVLIYLGTHGHPHLLAVGLGMTAYGFAYFVFHDVVVHRRVRHSWAPRGRYLRHIVRAHLIHHKTLTREEAVSFGFLFAPGPVAPARRGLLALVLLAVAPAVAGSQQLRLPRVDVDFDPEADFSSFQTYGWKDPLRPAEDQKAHTSIVWYVDAELRKKGLEKTGASPDLWVRYYAKGKSRLKGTPSQSDSRLPGGTGSLTASVDFQKVREGTLILELQRTKDEAIVWRAGSDFSSIDAGRLDAEIRSAVRLLLGRYPPPPP